MEAKRELLSRTQLMSILWVSLLAPAAELLPRAAFSAAGRGAWTAPLLALPVMLLAGWLVGRVCREEGFSAGVERCFGRLAGTVVLLIYMAWAVVLLSLRLRLCAQRLLDAGRRDGSLWFFLITTAVAAVWMAWGKVTAFGRSAQVMLTTLLLAAGVVLGLSVFRVQVENVLPLWTGGFGPVFRAAGSACGVLGYGLYAAFLLGDTKWSKGEGKVFLWWTTAGCVLLTVSLLVINGCFGPALAQSLSSPFFSLAKSVGVEGAFQRVESVVAALWIFADLGMAAVLLYAIQDIWKRLYKRGGLRGILIAVGAAGLLLAGFAYPDGAAAEAFYSSGAMTVSLVLALLVPAVGLWVGAARGGGERKKRPEKSTKRY